MPVVGTVLPLMFLGWTGVSLWAAYRMGVVWSPSGASGGGVRGARWTVQALVLAVLLPLPLLDELLAQSQWRSLCRDGLGVQVQAGGPPVDGVHHSVSMPEPVYGLMVPVLRHAHRYTDVATQQVLVSFFSYEAQGGKLARMAGRPDTPLTLQARCGPPDPQALLARAGAGARTDRPMDGPGAAPSP